MTKTFDSDMKKSLIIKNKFKKVKMREIYVDVQIKYIVLKIVEIYELKFYSKKY